jgi:hypothetical protein
MQRAWRTGLAAMLEQVIELVGILGGDILLRQSCELGRHLGIERLHSYALR